MIALYQTLKIPFPSLRFGNPKPMGPAILIYGGATATGLFALQFARLSGCRVLSTCSPRNFQLVKALGAHEVFDYHNSEACAAAIRTATQNNLLYAFDCVSTGSSLQICADALTSRSGVAVYTGALPISDMFPRQDVQHGWTSGYSGGFSSSSSCACPEFTLTFIQHSAKRPISWAVSNQRIRPISLLRLDFGN